MDTIDHEFIYISNPWINVQEIMINEDPYINLIAPFPRSTLLIADDYLESRSELYLVNRNFDFKKYSLDYYGEGAINEVYSYQLNVSYINISCSDLFQVPAMEYFLLLFC